MWKLKGLTAALLFIVSVGFSAGQRSKSCDTRRSNTDSNKVNVHCDCMQRLTQMNLQIARLTINQTGCAEPGIELNWRALETMVAPETLILAGAQIFFVPNSSDGPWNSSIKILHFVDSEIKELPANVFSGMTRLQEVKLLGSAVEAIKSDAFSNLSMLKLIEFGNSSVSRIEEYAFNNLSSLKDLAFAFSSIGSIETGAISLLPSSDILEQRCQDIGRTISDPADALGNILGRELTSVGNIPFPEYGTRLVFLGNNIISVNSKAVNTKYFGFLIVGRNHIVTIEPEAFEMELYNECEISAALFVGNTIDTLNSLAFAGLRARNDTPDQTFIAVANNTFLSVFEQAFQLSSNIAIFAVEENRFTCVCNALGWILSEGNSQIQRDLERELITKATCLDGTHLVSFSSSCTDHGEPSSLPPNEHTTVAPQNATNIPPVTDIPEPNSAATFTLPTSILTFFICYQLL